MFVVQKLCAPDLCTRAWNVPGSDNFEVTVEKKDHLEFNAGLAVGRFRAPSRPSRMQDTLRGPRTITIVCRTD